jgi:hypothetical protein
MFPRQSFVPNHHWTLLLLLLLVGCSIQSCDGDSGVKRCGGEIGWIGEREVKVNPQRQIGGQSILPILFYAVIKIELHGES